MKQILQRLLLLTMSLFLVTTTLMAQAPLRHVVKKLETVYSISKRYGVSEEEIYRLNEGSQWGIREGQTLLIPQRKPDTIYVEAPAVVQAEPGIHVVQSGETLYSISRKYGLTVSQLLELNPQKHDAQIAAGERVVVVSGARIEQAPNPLDGTQIEQVRVALILPLRESGQPSRYLHFYEGALLAIERLQRQGVSIDLQVDAAVNSSALEQLLKSKEGERYDLIIGGDSEQSVELLAQRAKAQQAVYLSPFVWQSGKGQLYDRFFQLNPAQYRVTERLQRAFVEHYANYEVLLVRCGDGDQDDKFKAIETACREAGITMQSRSLRELTIGQWPRQSGKRCVILLNSSSKNDLTAVLDAMRDAQLSTSDYQLFGYPQWQTYGKAMNDRLREVGATIFSTFYWDKELPESQQVRDAYKHWYRRDIEEGYPSYALLGYDVVGYFIAALSSYGRGFQQYQHQLPSDGVQSGFLFAPAIAGRTSGRGGYTNLNLFFITYSPLGERRVQIPLAE